MASAGAEHGSSGDPSDDGVLARITLGGHPGSPEHVKMRRPASFTPAVTPKHGLARTLSNATPKHADKNSDE